MTKFITALFFGFFLIAGDMNAFAEEKHKAPMSVEGAETIGVEKAKALLDAGAVFVDLRQPDDFDKSHIPSAELMELGQGFNKDGLEMIADTDQEVVFYCYGTGCLRSSMASESAVKWGYTKIKYFREGMPAWVDAGYPVEVE